MKQRVLILKTLGLVFLGVFLGLLWASSSQACPFCVGQGQTLSGDAKQATLILFGSLVNADEDKETTDLKIDLVVKDHPVRNNRNLLPLRRYIPPALDGKAYKYLVFVDPFEKGLDPYRGVAVISDSQIGRYLKGSLAKIDAPVPDRLAYFFDYLGSKEDVISGDAYREFANCDYKDFRTVMNGKLAKSAPHVVTWLKNSDTPPYRIGLFASMLGHCGKAEDAKVLRTMLDDPDRRGSTGMDGVFAGYILLEPKAGLTYLKGVLQDSKQEYFFRHSALRALRFFHDYRSDVVSKKDLVDALSLLLTQEDMADLALDDLRKWEAWESTERILALRQTAVFKQAIVHRSLLRFCLAAKGNAAAAAYVAQQRQANADLVERAEEVLRLEQLINPVPNEPGEPGKAGQAKKENRKD